MSTSLKATILVGILTAALSAQNISGVVSPPIASPGQPVTLTVYAVQNIVLPDSCLLRDIRVGTPTGPVLGTGAFCLTVLYPINAGQSYSQTWQPPASAGPGLYWFRVRYLLAGAPVDEFFCFEIRSTASTAPTLLANTIARVGQPLIVTLGDPVSAGAPYFAAASLTSNVGIPLGTTVVCLDLDLLFSLSFPSPIPGLFVNFQGTLDAAGSAPAITLNIPPDPALVYLPVKLQAVVLDATGVRLSNGLAFTVAP